MSKASQETQPGCSIQDKTAQEWQYLNEIVLLLNIAVARIQHGMKDGDESVNTLLDSFSTMVNSMSNISNTASQLDDSPDKQAILDACTSVEGKIQSAIVAFQFYDRLTQRLEHVSNSLSEVSKNICNEDNRCLPDAWQKVHQLIKDKYTLDSDQKMLAALLAGVPMEQAINDAIERNQPDDEMSVDLF